MSKAIFYDRKNGNVYFVSDYVIQEKIIYLKEPILKNRITYCIRKIRQQSKDVVTVSLWPSIEYGIKCEDLIFPFENCFLELLLDIDTPDWTLLSADSAKKIAQQKENEASEDLKLIKQKIKQEIIDKRKNNIFFKWLSLLLKK